MVMSSTQNPEAPLSETPVTGYEELQPHRNAAFLNAFKAVASTYKCATAWLRRQLTQEISNAAESVKLQDYKPEDPIATIRYCLDKIYFMFQKTLDSVVRHPLLEGAQVYYRRVSISPRHSPWLLFRIQHLTKPMAALYARYIAIIFAYRSNLMTAAIVNSDIYKGITQNSKGFYNGDLKGLIRSPFRIRNSSAPAGGLYVESLAVKANINWASQMIHMLKPIIGEKFSFTSSESASFGERFRKNPTGFVGPNQGIIPVNHAADYEPAPNEDRMKQACMFPIHMLRMINSTEMESEPISPSYSANSLYFEQALSALTSLPIMDSLIFAPKAYKSTASADSLGYDSTSSYNGLSGCMSSYTMGPMPRGFSTYAMSQQDYPYSDLRDGKLPISISYFDPMRIMYSKAEFFKEVSVSHTLRGISHCSPLKPWAKTHSDGVKFFTGPKFLHHFLGVVSNWRNFSFWAANNQRWSDQSNLLYARDPDNQGCHAMVKCSYLSSSKIDSELTDMQRKETKYFNMYSKPMGFMSPSNLIEEICFGATPKEVFGFDISPIPTDKDIAKIATWLENNGRFVVSVFSPILASLENIFSELKKSINDPMGMHAIENVMSTLGALHHGLKYSYNITHSGSNYNQVYEPGTFINAPVFNESVRAFHSIREVLNAFDHSDLLMSVLSSKIETIRKFSETKAKELLKNYTVNNAPSPTDKWSFTMKRKDDRWIIEDPIT